MSAAKRCVRPIMSAPGAVDRCTRSPSIPRTTGLSMPAGAMDAWRNRRTAERPGRYLTTSQAACRNRENVPIHSLVRDTGSSRSPRMKWTGPTTSASRSSFRRKVRTGAASQPSRLVFSFPHPLQRGLRPQSSCKAADGFGRKGAWCRLSLARGRSFPSRCPRTTTQNRST